MDGLAYDDMDEFGRELDDPFEELVQDVAHVLLEAFGSNPDVLNRGVGLASALSGPANRIPHLKAQIESQLQDDTRITNATATITATDTRGRYRIDLELVVNGTEIALHFVADSVGGIRRLA